MSTYLVSRASTLLEVIQFAGDLLLLTLGCSPLARLAELLYRFARALTWLAEFTLLLLALLLSALGDVLPLVGRHAGRWAGRTVAAGRQARVLYNAHLAPVVTSIDRNGRAFVLEQLGSGYPALAAAIDLPVAPQSSVQAVSSTLVVSDVAIPRPTRRQLLQQAKSAHISGYSRRSTAELRMILLGCE